MFDSVYESQARDLKRRVKYTGSDALRAGEGLCYVRDYSSATITGDAVTDACGKRDKRVARPSASNNRWFAGVTVAAYPSVSGGRWIEIYEPGSVVPVAFGVPTVACASGVDGTMMTCSAGAGDAGMWTWKGYMGRGSAIALQTKALSTVAGTNTIISRSTDGTASLGIGTGILTKTAAFTYAQAGDVVYITGGATTATGATPVTAGRYTIVSNTADAATLSSSPCAAASLCNFYCLSAGNPTVLAYLFDGDESGLQQEITPKSATAIASMIGGVTYIAGGWTQAVASTYTLANGTKFGEKKGFVGLGTLTTSGYVVTVTNGKQLNKSTALATALFDAAAEVGYLYWYDSMWILDWSAGATLG
jgi:hypothetical protein